MQPRAPHIAAAARGSRRWWRSNWPRHAGRSGSRTAARRRSGRPELAKTARHPDQGDKNWESKRGIHGTALPLYLLDHDAVDLVGDVVEAIGDLFEMVI